MKKIAAVMLAIALCLSAAVAFADGNYPCPGTVISHNASLRESAKTSATRLASVMNGEELTVLGEDGDFYYCEYVNSKGKVFDGYILKVYMMADPEYIVLRKGNTALYAAPMYTDKRVGSMGAYEKLLVIDETDKYWIVNLRDASAFVSKKSSVWLQSEIDNMLMETEKGAVVEATTSRTGPGTSWPSVKKLSAGTEIEICGYDGNWTIITYKNAVAYVNSEDIVVANGAVSE
ncbi:MAG: hypothetical protein PHI27_01345 [Eubacteriales bacterium]|nr:hypothetical protein [Eubacteriales bacterium]MDD3880880.1 hypothetical protein [Eubacteriales bacterium]MDD4511753.1 hypothetical protein [Eubacteriales bacterium]